MLSGRCYFATTRSSSSASRSYEGEVAFRRLLPAFRVLSSSVLRFATASLAFNVTQSWPGILKFSLTNNNVVFPSQAEYSYFSADFRLKIFLYSYIIA